MAALALMGLVSPSPFALSTPGASGSHLSSATCSTIVSNSSLSAGVYNLYYGNGNRSGPGSGVINQSPPGPSAYPPEPTAVRNVVNGWQALCSSSAFYILEQRWGPTNATWSALATNATGIYEDVFTITWQANASQCSPSFGACIGRAGWNVNVASGLVTGPQTVYFSPQPGI